MIANLARTYLSVVLGTLLFLFPAVSLQANSDVTEIKKLIEAQNIEKAFERIKSFQAGKPKLMPEVQLLFGDLYLALDQPSKASEFFEKTLFSSTEFDDSANAGMAEAQFVLGNLVKAESLADKALEQNPDQIRAKLVKGAIVAERGNLLTARKLFKSAMKSSQTSTLAGRKFAKALMRQNLLGEAEEVLKDTLISNSLDAPTWNFTVSFCFSSSASTRQSNTASMRKKNIVVRATQLRPMRFWLGLTFEAGQN